MNINTTEAWDKIKAYLSNFVHGLEVELEHIEAQLKPSSTKKTTPASTPTAEQAK